MTREYIRKEIQLYGESDDGKFTRTFRIAGSDIREGGSSVCYEAYYDGSSRGVLKEFYPYGITFKPRSEENGQLVCSEEFQQEIEDFKRKLQAYISPYIELQKMKQQDEKKELSVFVPPFEIYYGLAENSTVYIYTPLPRFLTFEEFCKEIHEHPKYGAAYKFIQVIDAVRYLARCAAELQSGGLVNRDIKPSNIGFFRRGDELQPQTLAMFDVDSVCFVGSSSLERVYSHGYTEPEIDSPNYRPNYQTDIYSIGAVLFHALIVNEEVRSNDFLYKDEYYSRLEEFVSSSELIKNAGADFSIKARLTEILLSCLCGRDRRYRDPQTGIALGCEKLIEDLDELFNEFTKGRTLYEERKNYLIDLEMNSKLVLQYHLYQYPLYSFIENRQRDINVVILGWGKYSGQFLDACLQAGQIVDRVLNVKVILECLAERDEYLRNRPALSQFFNVDGSLAGKLDDGYEVYGNVNFIEMPELNQIFGDNPDVEQLRGVLALLSDAAYIFIDLKNDTQNLEAAHRCAEISKTSCVNFVRLSENDSDNFDGIIPVYVNADVSRFPEFQEIERMAFNAHLSWLPDMNIDHEKIRREFQNPYNHISSLANVLNVKYKLFSVNPEFDTLNFDEAAKRFYEFLQSEAPEDRRKYNELICFEHRRWTTERLCDGCIRKLPEECKSDSDTRDRENIGRRRVTRHVCIVRSKANQILHDEWDMHKWNNPEAEELAKLDELDRMSVELHCVFLSQAKEAMKENILDDSTLARISGLIESEPQALSAFQDLCICMRDLLTGLNDERVETARNKVSHYSRLNSVFKGLLSSERISSENREEAVREIKVLESKFRVILDSMKFRDFKHSDTDLIDNVPFILTYTYSKITMVIPYFDDINDRTKFFGNAASAIMINPSKLIYLSFLEDDEDVNKLTKSIKTAGAYITRKTLRAEVEFIIARPDYIELPEDLEGKIRDAFNGADVKILNSYSVFEAAEIFAQELELERSNSERGSVFAIEKNSAYLSGVLEGSGLYKLFSYYKFNSNTMKFIEAVGCELFRYVRKSHALMRSDMFVVSKGSGPEFFRDYAKLWDKYRNNRAAWKALCDGLRDHDKETSKIAEFPMRREGQKNSTAETLRYILPSGCREAVQVIFFALKKDAVIENVSSIRSYTTNTFEVLISDRCGYGKKYDELLGNPYRLMSSDAVSVNDDDGRNLEIIFNNLMVESAAIPNFGTEKCNKVLELMEFFRGLGFVINLRVNKNRGTMSFSYASREIKELMTKSGRILEIYVYHKAREAGIFDDVISSLEIKWGQSLNIKNEFDCVLTKGFRTLFVECKARNVLEQGMFNQVAGLSRLGINVIPVLVADTGGIEEGRAAKINRDMRERGRELGIVTVWKMNEIENIGVVLSRIINGTYTPQL